MKHPLILMAAGVSSRMKKAFDASACEGIEIDPKLIQEANTLPKCMLSVGPNGTRFIDYIIWNAAQGGFKNIIVLLNPADTVSEAHITQVVKKLGLPVTAHFAIQHLRNGREKPWGTGDAIFQALEQFPLSEDAFYSVSNSDNLCSAEVFKKAYETKQNTIFSYDTASLGILPENRVKYGLILSNPKTHAMVGIVEKPPLEEIAILEKTNSLSVNMNIMTLSYKDTFEKLKKLVPHPVRDEKEITDTLEELAEEHNLKSKIIYESIPDLTSKLDIPVVQHLLESSYPELQACITK